MTPTPRKLAAAHRQRIEQIAELIAAGRKVTFLRRQLYREWFNVQYLAQIQGERERVIFTAGSENQYKDLLALTKALLKELRTAAAQVA